MDTGSHTLASVSFGRFQVLPHWREFLAAGRPVQIGGRAFDVLMALIDAQGTVVTKNALMERVWPDRIVEENNLEIQISALRAAFGADRDLIRTVAGRGRSSTGASLNSFMAASRAAFSSFASTLPRYSPLARMRMTSQRRTFLGT
jgi:hypothetical protein